MPLEPLPLLQGTLDLLVLRCLSGGARHGYAIASMVREQTGGNLSVEDAALYPALHRLHWQAIVDAEWGPSENNRRARFYTLTGAGRARLREETANWRRYPRAGAAVLQGTWWRCKNGTGENPFGTCGVGRSKPRLMRRSTRTSRCASTSSS